jgi:acetolactate synthase-1/2/3 large subunit
MNSLLASSSRPLFLLGAGARNSADKIVRYCERNNIPMETTWNAVDLVPYDHPLFVGRLGIVATRGANKAVQECDLLVAIGARLDEPTIAYKYDRFAPKAKKIMVDIDYGESLKVPHLDGVFRLDAGAFIDTLPDVPFDFEGEWLKQCRVWKLDTLEGDTITYKLLDMLNEHLPEDAVIVIDCGCLAVNMFCAGFRNKKGQRFIMSSCGLGSMGGALPVAIGAAVATKKRVFVVSGDGSFMQSSQELETIHRLKLPVKVFILNNNIYASIHGSELRAFGRTKSAESIPDLRSVAEAYKVEALGMPSAFLFNWKMIDNDRPQVMIFAAPEDEQALPRVFPLDGRGDLGDMYPYE